MRRLPNWIRKLILVLVDILIIVICCIFMLFLVPLNANLGQMILKCLTHAAIMIICVMTIRLTFKIYFIAWRYASIRDCLILMIADGIAYVFTAAISKIIFTNISGIYMVNCYSLALLITIASRFSYRWIEMRFNNSNKKDRENGEFEINRKNLAIVGAGEAGTQLVRELLTNPNSEYTPVCLFDGDRSKIGSRINGIPIVGNDKEMSDKLKGRKVDSIAIAIPSLDKTRYAELVKSCVETGKQVLIYNFQAVKPAAEKEKPNLRNVNIADLLNRDEIHLDMDSVNGFIRDQTVLVTGGGGSIGSELCRQIASMNPEKLIILDIYENNAYEIQQELIRNFPMLNMSVEIASIRDREKIFSLMKKYNPSVVFHAAAHKHVPLMEACASEAVKNNIFGTKNLLDAAEDAGVLRFIMISTDKAVNPTNIMGATKRFCELMIQSRFDSKTDFAAVRFGNVLGSNGSVIPLFTKQIEAGGPITITDMRITRYFMTIPEAVALVLSAGAMAKASQIFVLEMGKPVKILDLAIAMVHMAGLIPYCDIDIQEVGLRPGEKLFEELLLSTAALDKTPVSQIMVESGCTVDKGYIEESLDKLSEALEKGDDVVFETMHRVVPTYNVPEFVNASVGVDGRIVEFEKMAVVARKSVEA